MSMPIIDIEKYTNSDPGILSSDNLINYIHKEVLSALISNSFKYNKILVDLNIYSHISCTPNYHFLDQQESKIDLIQSVGYLPGVEVYLDNTYSLKCGEFILFNTVDDIPFYKNLLRTLKLERIKNGIK